MFNVLTHVAGSDLVVQINNDHYIDVRRYVGAERLVEYVSSGQVRASWYVPRDLATDLVCMVMRCVARGRFDFPLMVSAHEVVDFS